MKKIVLFVLVAALTALILQPVETQAKKKKVSKVYQKMEDKANKMTKKGGFAFVGVAVSDENRIDVGRCKAHQDALQKMTEAKRSYVETTIHDFRESIGVNDEFNDVFRSVTDVIAADFLKGARIIDFEMSQSKTQKKDGAATYYVLVVITPEYTYQSIVDDLKNGKGSKAVLYQRYVDSEAQKIHDEKIKKFKEEFNIEDN